MSTSTQTLRQMPSGMPEASCGYSNFDYLWDDGGRDAVNSGEFFARHAAWNFNGCIWKDLDGYHEEVWVYHQHVATVDAETLDDLIEKVNSEYGYE